MNNELEGMWKEAVMAVLKFSWRTEENYKNLSQDSRRPRFEPGLPEYETEGLITRPRSLDCRLLSQR
jgi:hypothetical protein